MESMTEIFGDVIYSYTREQALEDGFLVDVSETASEAGFTIPVAMTRAAWTDLVEWNDNNRAFQDEAGRLWDVLTMARYFARGVKGSSVNCEAVSYTHLTLPTIYSV